MGGVFAFESVGAAMVYKIGRRRLSVWKTHRDGRGATKARFESDSKSEVGL